MRLHGCAHNNRESSTIITIVSIIFHCREESCLSDTEVNVRNYETDDDTRMTVRGVWENYSHKYNLNVNLNTRREPNFSKHFADHLNMLETGGYISSFDTFCHGLTRLFVPAVNLLRDGGKSADKFYGKIGSIPKDNKLKVLWRFKSFYCWAQDDGRECVFHQHYSKIVDYFRRNAYEINKLGVDFQEMAASRTHRNWRVLKNLYEKLEQEISVST